MVGHFAEAAGADGRARRSPRTRRCPATAPPRSSPRATFKARWRPTTRPWTRTRPAGGAAGRERVRGRRAVLFGVLIYAEAQTERRPYAGARPRPRRRRRRRAPRRDPRRAPRPRARPRWRTSRGSGASTFRRRRGVTRGATAPSPRSKSGGARLQACAASASTGGAHDLRSDGARPDRPVALRRSSEFRETPAPPRSAGPTGKGPSDASGQDQRRVRCLPRRRLGVPRPLGPGPLEAYDAELHLLCRNCVV